MILVLLTHLVKLDPEVVTLLVKLCLLAEIELLCELSLILTLSKLLFE